MENIKEKMERIVKALYESGDAETALEEIAEETFFTLERSLRKEDKRTENVIESTFFEDNATTWETEFFLVEEEAIARSKELGIDFDDGILEVWEVERHTIAEAMRGDVSGNVIFSPFNEKEEEEKAIAKKAFDGTAIAWWEGLERWSVETIEHGSRILTALREEITAQNLNAMDTVSLDRDLEELAKKAEQGTLSKEILEEIAYEIECENAY